MIAASPQILSSEMQASVPMTDEDLLPRIIAGDSASLELLMRRHNQRLFRIARSVLRDESEAEDVVQETYVRAHGQLRRFEGRSSVATWLSRIAFHEALRRRRRRGRTRTTESAYSALRQEPALDPAQCGQNLDQQVLREVLAAALDALPTALRAVVMLRLVEGLSTRETAASLRMTEANVKVRLLRGRRLLMERLQERAIPELRNQFAFAQERCDRIVAGAFMRIERNGTSSI